MGTEDDIDSTTSDGQQSFIVSWTDEERTLESREDAVALAKQMSQERRVQIERSDGMESMQFFAGALETFIYETRDRRRRRDDD